MDSPKSLQPVVLPPTTDRASKLKATCHGFAKALEAPPSPEKLCSRFFTSSPKITEHGPEWARERLPFLAKTYSGSDEFVKYFKTLSEVLSMKPDPAPASHQFAVQVDAFRETEDESQENGHVRGSGLVFVQGGGEFKSVKTGKSWKETFVWKFSEFDQDGKIGHWEIWADPLSAWNAVSDGQAEAGA
ncbi:hypothetical protein CKM354_000818300 [Cercospora kikuchii]|uniref:Uncharacterized protein n=1 Tax=Cercospora kikuchii TaxID=84275 RepID=A0A9P3FJA0_9PEZI|nr:uncharacterized protein CKM354_000818300 [Cercospora kikuchii]GIZ44999.1 hypothetical protein CKM354_000818300 [Cercospora kikuchii]